MALCVQQQCLRAVPAGGHRLAGARGSHAAPLVRCSASTRRRGVWPGFQRRHGLERLPHPAPAPARPYICTHAFFDQAWSPSVEGAVSLAPQLFAFSLFPYLAFLFFLHRSGQTPKLTLFGFYFLLAFVGATIPAGIYAKVHYGTSLANVDWLHGSAESLLTITNLLIVVGLRQAIRKEEAKTQVAQAAEVDLEQTAENGVPAPASASQSTDRQT